jgi:hypothetical protein
MATNLAYQAVAGYGFGDFTAAFDSIQSHSRPYSGALGDKMQVSHYSISMRTLLFH